MGILITFVVGCLFWLRIKNETGANKIRILAVLSGFVIFSLVLNWYLEFAYQYEYGIAGSDLQMYFDSAKLLASGYGIDDLIIWASGFNAETVGVGYIIYIYFLRLMLFTPTIISIPFSLNMVYLVQDMVAVVTLLNIADVFRGDNGRKRNIVFYLLAMCAPVLQMPSLLMRDIWILFLISYLAYGVIRKNMPIWQCVLLLVAIATMRIYALMLVVPILLFYKLKKERLAAVSSVVMFVILFFGGSLISDLANWIGIYWKYSTDVNLMGLVSFLLYPNPITQSQQILNIQTGYHLYMGGNTEWIYYMFSCWNMYIYPIAGLGVIKCIKKKLVNEALVWGFMILNIGVLYGIFYNYVSAPRHKLMLVMSLVYFFHKGIEDKSRTFKIIYSLIIISLLLLMLLLAL